MISSLKEVGGNMQKPNLMEAKMRTKKEVLTKTDDYIVENHLKEFGKGKTYFVKTYGCQMNEHDTENIKAILEDMSYTACDKMEEADLILLNTCAIRENAHNKVFGMIGRIKHLKESKPDLIAGVCGCMAQEEVVVDEILHKYRFLDLVFGTHNIHKLPMILEHASQNPKVEVDVLSMEGDVIENVPVKRDHKYKAWVNIMYGCDKFCTYCIVPYTRGKQRSRHPKYILDEVKQLIQDGYQEVTLLGQNVNAYGKDLDINYGMEQLLEDVAKTNISRVRFVTSHPWDFTDGMIDVIGKYDNIMPYIHLPLQSGSNRILKLMGRRYTKESYLELYHKLKKAMPYSSITTDIIVGFPGETEEDFQDTLDIYHECQYDSAFTFIFSPRVGTPACRMQDDVDQKTKEDRLHRLNEIVNEYSKKANDQYLDQEVPVLLEGYSENNKEMLMGYTDTMKLVNVKGDPALIGTIQRVKITDVKTWSMDGEVVK